MNWLSSILLLAPAVLTLAACSDVAFQAQKTETLSKASVFGDTSGTLKQGANSDAGDALTQPARTGEGESGSLRGPAASGSIRGPVSGVASGVLPTTIRADGTAGDISQPPYLGTPGQLSQPITRVCSDRESQQMKNLKGALAENGAVGLQVNGKTCSADPATVLRLAQLTTLTIADLQATCSSILPSMGELVVQFIIEGQSSPVRNPRSINVLWARNSDTSVPAESADSLCNLKASPLVIHMAADPLGANGVELTSVAAGVDFDLLGARNDHRKVRIGWFSNLDYRMLVLPNAHGQVSGIDELFGDNTLGPDGDFAANGYAALAKYDGTTADGHFKVALPDGRIDRRDPVFERLRLWQDTNLDGIAQADELVSLTEAGVAFIDLDYSSTFQESDVYGNETRMKSVVGFDNGALDLIFDLWFIYQQTVGVE